MISGLTYIPNFISPQKQEELISSIDSATWLTDLKRRTQHYGYKYDYTKKSINVSMRLGLLPSWLNHNDLINQDLFQTIDQVIINEYLPGQGIARHVDCIPCFGPTIASLSLNSACIMKFEHLTSNQTKELVLEPCSLLVLTNEARYDWQHSIAPRSTDIIKDELVHRSRRISLTYRTVI